MDSPMVETAPTENNNAAQEVTGNGSLKRKRESDHSDDEKDFLGFDSAEQNVSQHMIQNIKKICTDSSSEESSPKKQQNNVMYRTTDICDPAYRIPFKYGWKRELVLRAEPTMSKEKGEVYYITPTGKKLRTRHEIMNNLHDDLTINNFTLVKEAIGAPAEDEIIRPAKYYNYSRRSNVDPVIAEAVTPPLGKRVPKPKMPKGASPPPPNLPENAQEKVALSPPRKTPVKGKMKGDARCTINCPPAVGKIPSLQCKVCLCLYHHECAKKPLNEIDGGTSFTCENCNFKFSKPNQNSSTTKKHHQPTTPTLAQHNFEKNPQAVVSLNGKKFIVYETDTSNGVSVPPKKKSTKSAVAAQKVESSGGTGGGTTKASLSRQESFAPSVSPFNFSTNFFSNVAAGFDVLCQTFQYLKVQELQRASRVCRLWNQIAQSQTLWQTVRMKNSHVNDWKGFVRTLKRNGTIHLDLRKVLMGNQEESWRQFSESIGEVEQLQFIDLCRCQSNIVENLFVSNPNLKTINASMLKDESLNMKGLKNLHLALEELRIRSTHANGLKILDFSFAPLLNLRHLSLTTVENLHELFDNKTELRELAVLESLEIGNCDQLNDDQFSENLRFLKNLQRLRVEKGSQNFNITKVFNSIAELNNLVQLELINCDVKTNFVESIRECVNVKRLLLIPTYVSQSAATNYRIMDGMMQMTNLDVLHWVVTNELLRVTELYQSDNNSSDKGNKKSPEKQVNSGASSPVKAKDSIPVLKPVPGKEDTEDIDIASSQQADTNLVDIVSLKSIESILQRKLINTNVKLIKVSHQHTWRQVLDNSA